MQILSLSVYSPLFEAPMNRSYEVVLHNKVKHEYGNNEYITTTIFETTTNNHNAQSHKYQATIEIIAKHKNTPNK